LERLDVDVDISRAWETIRQDTKFSTQESPGYYEMKQHKLWLS
jgi:hypothetical protein